MDQTDDVPLEIQLMRDLRALETKLASAALSDDDRAKLRQKISDTQIRLAVIHEQSGRAFLANPEKIL